MARREGYVTYLPGDPPPYLLVLYVGREFLVWNRWNGTYGGFTAAERIGLETLHKRREDIELLQDIWTSPRRRPPRARANRVTKDIAEHLTELAPRLRTAATITKKWPGSSSGASSRYSLST